MGANWLYYLLTFKVNLLSIILGIVLMLGIFRLIIYVIQLRKPLRIIRADYGTDNKWVDFTTRLNDSIVNSKISVQLSNNFVGKDPVYGADKYATIRYKHNGIINTKKIQEGHTIVIP